ncbi:MAG: hypothetical protein MUF08_06430, partial [Burkholderiaceae bacterium]|nr:hypothetical protein [Burkholderiaceae bacterium]
VFTGPIRIAPSSIPSVSAQVDARKANGALGSSLHASFESSELIKAGNSSAIASIDGAAVCRI